MSRTNIELDDRLVRGAQRLTGLKTKKEVVNAALQMLIRLEERKGILRNFESGIWKGDLKEMRRNRTFGDFKGPGKPRAGGGRNAR